MRSQLQNLLYQSFPDFFETRIYAKQFASFRLLVWNNNNLIAQTAIEHRMISIDGNPASIFGIVDLCVSEPMRSNGIATRLLEEVEKIARDHEIEYLLLFAENPRLYDKFGFKRCRCSYSWLGIDEHKTLGILKDKSWLDVDECKTNRNNISDFLMVKPLTDLEIPKQKVDLLGYLF